MLTQRLRWMGLVTVSAVVLALWTVRMSAAEKATEPSATIDVVDSTQSKASGEAAAPSKTSKIKASVVDEKAGEKTKGGKSQTGNAAKIKPSDGEAVPAAIDMAQGKSERTLRPMPGGFNEPNAAVADSKKNVLAGKNAKIPEPKDEVAGDTTVSVKEGNQEKAAGSVEAAKKTAESKAVAQDSSKPSSEPEEIEADAVAVEAASFNGVVPGVSTQKDVEKAWGTPVKDVQKAEGLRQLFSIEPFKHIEVAYQDGKVASVVIQFERPFPAEAVAQQLELTKIREVLVFGETGDALGIAYPERGVLFSFELGEDPKKPSMKVVQIILEPITAEPFVLRAESALEHHPKLARRDLERALGMDRKNARAQWLYSRVLVAAEDYPQALNAANEAVRLDAKNARYHVTRAQILAQLGQLIEAANEAQKAAGLAEDRPHLKARALCLQGDLLASGDKPDYRKAVVLHTQAIQAADPLAGDSRPAIRVAAKEVLVDGHLGAAHDIAWGDWKEKDKSVPRWLNRAVAVAEDLVDNEGASEEQRFHVHSRALAAMVGARGALDPASSAKEVTASGEKLIASVEEPARKAQYQWELGMSLYDAAQVAQARSNAAEALKYGQAAAEYLEKAKEKGAVQANSMLLGKLYFRLGAINSTGSEHNHRAAVAWFDKAIPLLDRPTSDDAADTGRQGEAFVSMGVSYWEVGQHEKAVNLTQKGIEMMERGIQVGRLDRSAMAVPYHNLSTMHRQQGNTDVANHFQEMASRLKSEKTK